MGSKPRSSLKRRIVKYVSLLDHPVGPKEISRITKINYNSVKVYCRQLVNEGSLTEYVNLAGERQRGQYITLDHIVSERGAVREPLLVHGIKLEFRYNPREGPPFLPLSRQVTFRGSRHPINRSITDSWEYDGRTITITENAKVGLVELFPHSTKEPYDYHSFQRFVAWLQGRYPRIPLESWTVRQLGINWDRTDIRLDGLSKLTLQAFNNVWITIYQKGPVVRIEAHGITDITLFDMFDLLENVMAQIDNIKLVKK